MVIAGILLILFLITSAISDIKEKKIYLKNIVIFFIIGILINILNLNISIIEALLGMTIGLFLIGLAYLTGEKIGRGDGMVFAVTGVYLGFWGNLLLLLMSMMLCSFFSVIFLIARKADRNTRIPMVPFLLLPAFYEVAAALT